MVDTITSSSTVKDKINNDEENRNPDKNTKKKKREPIEKNSDSKAEMAKQKMEFNGEQLKSAINDAQKPNKGSPIASVSPPLEENGEESVSAPVRPLLEQDKGNTEVQSQIQTLKVNLERQKEIKEKLEENQKLKEKILGNAVDTLDLGTLSTFTNPSYNRRVRRNSGTESGETGEEELIRLRKENKEQRTKRRNKSTKR
ncbi:hypothetical protein CS022_22185 [Veronia nyctiphanis]|uniref:Uncharacterized protein n=1 Tax=Veronia nyctiphanis TaxID=1278244 RepID=A0A4Q0YJF3_9GAMM|nr:hypothetical protein [Veronia nyctiphanis]RXJ70840.1 hypothetical protein CS022_22185 [Veronia nyctiphanis]